MSNLAKADVFSSLIPAEGSRSIVDTINMNTGGQGMSESDITRLSIPSGGGVAWEIPGLGDEAEVVKDLNCVILSFKDHRVYYEGEYTGDNRPPRCASRDMVNGSWVKNYDDDIDDWETEGRFCSTCPMNQWGSKGRGKACSERRLLLILLPDHKLPFLVDVSPGSLTIVRKYHTALTTADKVYCEVVTNLKLKKAESGGGIVYSQVHPAFVRDLSQEEKIAVAQMQQAFSADFAGQEPSEEPPF